MYCLFFDLGLPITIYLVSLFFLILWLYLFSVFWFTASDYHFGIFKLFLLSKYCFSFVE
jgi:hypothetical protein